MNLSHGSAWMPRVTPFFALKLMLFCTGWKSAGSPSAVIFAFCQFSLNQPRLSPCTGKSKTSNLGMFVSVTLSSFSNSIVFQAFRCNHMLHAHMGCPVHGATHTDTGLGPSISLRWRPSPAPTTVGCPHTTALWRADRIRNRCGSAPNRALGCPVHGATHTDTGLGPSISLRWRPSPAPTTVGCPHTTALWRADRIRNRCGSAPNRARCAAWWRRSRNGGHGPGGP